uniref:Uncharacterized protein n=1 Tax=Mus musculus TaxID=10090 RepID=Q3V0E2_MOUSE|nr:unnamed protein product [Mus musculus]|eukprot:XP_006498227.1 PREDICTED: uncharacterized protein LOC433416 isoform X1 [Mus musculus]
MASSGHDVSTSFVILIPRETSARRRKQASALLKEETRVRATSCWSWVPTDGTAPAPPTTDDTMFLGVVPCPDADLISRVSLQSHDAGNCSNLMEETKTFSSTESLQQLSQQLNGLVSEIPQDWDPERR